MDAGFGLARRRQNPASKLDGVKLPALRLRGHGYRAPFRPTTLTYSISQVLPCARCPGVTFGNDGKRRPYAPGVNLVTGQALFGTCKLHIYIGPDSTRA